MSHYSDLALVVLDKTDIPAHFGEKIAAILLGNEIKLLPSPCENTSALKRSIHGVTKSGTFKWEMAQLLDEAANNLLFELFLLDETTGLSFASFKWKMALSDKPPFESLRFIAETACTHLVIKRQDGVIENRTYMNPKGKEQVSSSHLYTIIKPEQCEALIADIEKLFSWCSNNLSSVVFALNAYGGDDEDYVQNAIDNAVVCEDLNEAGDYMAIRFRFSSAFSNQSWSY
jgi:hypothetical protein